MRHTADINRKTKKGTSGWICLKRLAAMLLMLFVFCQTVLAGTGMTVQAAQYVVVTTNFEKTLTASDGLTYRITVKCPQNSGIPKDAVLEVVELNEEESRGYLELAAKSGAVPENSVAETAGSGSELRSSSENGTEDGQNTVARAFDISIVDTADHSIVYEPAGNVEVTIQLVGTDLDIYDAVDVLHFVEEAQSDELAVQNVQSDVNGETLAFTTDSFSVYVVVAYTIEKVIEAGDGNTYKITVSYDENAGIPTGAGLDVVELEGDLYEEYLRLTAAAMEAADFEYARIFDISIVDENGMKIQPAAPVQVKAELLDAEADPEAFSVLHFEEDPMETNAAAEPEQVAAETDGNAVSFSAESFSAYAIVKGPTPAPVGWAKVTSLEELIAHGRTGLYIGHVDGYYFTGGMMTISGSRTGITKTKPAQSVPPAGAVPYYFEQVSGKADQVYAYCLNGEKKQYVRNTGNNSLSFGDETNRTAFTVTVDADGVVNLRNGAWYWNMQGGANGKAFAAYNAAGDPNANLYCWYSEVVGEEPYDLDGRAYGLMNYTDGTSGKALMAAENGKGSLEALDLTVMTKTGDYEDKLFVPKDSEITLWSFQWIAGDRYYLTADTGSGMKYLKIENGVLSLADTSDSSCEITVIPGTGIHEGEICLKAGTAVITYSGTVAGGFRAGTAAGSEWLKLVDLSELTSDYFMTYSADKVSISDPDVTNGSRIILYTRTWDEEKKRYIFYAVDHDGTLVRCYESGDSVQWVGGRLNTLLWNLVEYYHEETGEPNDYYELYNQYSENYLAPQLAGGQILSGEPIGINLDGRRKKSYYSTILAWDAGQYAYAGLKAEDGRIVSCPLAESDDFYFAVMQEENADGTLTTVPTVDNTQYGIKMKLIDFPDKTGGSNIQDTFLGSSAGGLNYPPTQGLLSTDLGEDGYPKNRSGVSMASLYAGAQEVNHLFIQSTYSGSGYYEYDSTQNFASLDKASGNFKVYRELGTMDGSSRNSLKHGQFMPYNDLEAGVFASVNGKNLCDALMNELPDSDPRKNEQMYLVKSPDYYFGAAIEAPFTQTPDGLDAWGHDIIYEFTGDDDFWFYVDGELVIDLGGIHSALAGSVNFSTGEVSVYGKRMTLRDIFYNNYTKRGHTKAEAQAYVDGIFEKNSRGQYIFKAYTAHTMSIFYMERGAGASNLHMRFNLASIKPGTVELSKELAGVDTSESVLAEFPYQIRYRRQGDDRRKEDRLLTQEDGEQSADGITVRYKDTVTPVEYRPVFEVDGVRYENVFLLKPGEVAEIALPDEAISYSVTECGVNTAVYSQVKVNGTAIAGTPQRGQTGRSDFSIDYAPASERARVAFVNEVDPDALRTLTITKKLYREDGVTAIRPTEDASAFGFRLYLGTEFDADLSAADMHTYHVKDPDGSYCSWDAAQQRFVPIGKTDYTALSAEEKAAVSFTTSMNGSISRIPAFYTVEIREVLAGTRYSVEERENEIPDGYSLQKYVLYNDASDAAPAAESDVPVQGTFVSRQDPHVDVCNLRGWGLRVNKQWSDAGYMDARDDIWFAVYTDDGTGSLTLVDGSIRQMKQNQSTLYWYYLKLPVSGISFDNYLIREVRIINPTVGAGGVVTAYDSVTTVGNGEKMQTGGRQKGETVFSDFTYTVLYEKGTVSPDSNVRVDTVTNNRPGIELKKQDGSGRPLAGVEFDLKDENGSRIGTFVSDASGLITVAFLRDDVDYTLTETKTPQGYHGLQGPLTLRLHNGTVAVSGAEPEDYELTQGQGRTPSLTVRNHPYTFRAVKTDGDSHEPLEGVTFALHRQIKVDGVTSVDLNPMPGFEELTTNADGIIPKLDNTLPAGTYELREKETAEEYQKLEEYILFTISPTGSVSLGTHSEAVTLEEKKETDGSVGYTMTVCNYSTKAPAPTGVTSVTKPYIWILVFGLLAAALALSRRRGGRKDGE